MALFGRPSNKSAPKKRHPSSNAEKQEDNWLCLFFIGLVIVIVIAMYHS